MINSLGFSNALDKEVQSRTGIILRHVLWDIDPEPQKLPVLDFDIALETDFEKQRIEFFKLISQILDALAALDLALIGVAVCDEIVKEETQDLIPALVLETIECLSEHLEHFLEWLIPFSPLDR
jgi:hypothetical protein